MGDIGEPLREVTFEPVPAAKPVPADPLGAPAPAETPEKVPVPA